MGVPNYFAERWWGAKRFLFRRWGKKFLVTALNYPPPWYTGFIMNAPLFSDGERMYGLLPSRLEVWAIALKSAAKRGARGVFF